MATITTLYRVLVCCSVVLIATSSMAMKGGGHEGHGISEGKMGHSSMTHGDQAGKDHFVHSTGAAGVQATFQVMSLASMKMKDPHGNTHHIMVSFSRNEKKMKQVVGRIEAISPSGKKQSGALQHFGGGLYAANFSFNESGPWEIVCLFKEQGAEQKMSFVYPHHEM
ncbi:hypothetical protein [Desulfogranum mediterraneum]|uniref:hypothetical protein n=1 Tax=Desulfogranum mediterraneum TaxID=160661 RepID=UPI000491874F|nr:hypothetical protein [Desulfogranum mediterraneum]